MMPDTKRFLLVMRIAIGLVVVVSSVLIHIHLGLPLLNAGYETGRLFLLEANTALAPTHHG